MSQNYRGRALTNFIGYFRVSTDRQGRSGLGLEAQREAVTNFISGRGTLLDEFTEIESVRKNDRPALNEALTLCRKKKATLLIARLDRLARSVSFISKCAFSDTSHCMLCYTYQ